MRQLIAFPCEGETLVGTLDGAPGSVGLLVVSGGSEIRAGAHRGMATLAARIAAAGWPVFRYDRRGVGDSTGEDLGFAGAAPDMRAAAAAFRAAAPGVTRLVGFGNCDAATALALFGQAAGVDALVLANPWIIHAADTLPPAAAIRARYAERLRDPRAWWRLVSGGVDLRKLLGGVRKLAVAPPSSALAGRLASALAGWPGAPTIVLARGDATALAFADHWRGAAFASVRDRAALAEIPTASHSFARAGDAAALEGAIVAALAAPD